MKEVFKEGDIVRKGTFVSSIKKIVKGKAILGDNNEVELERLSQVEICGGYDDEIILACSTMRAPAVASGEPIPLWKRIAYKGSSIEGKSIVSIIEENGFTVVSELQNWMAQNAPEFYLRTRDGI